MTHGLQPANPWLVENLNWFIFPKLLLGLYKHCRVDGKSMEPTLLEGDIVIYKPAITAKDILLNGSIVVISHPLKSKTLLIKRVYFDSKYYLDLRGDNESVSTDSRQFGLVNKNHLIGIVEAVVRSTAWTSKGDLLQRIWGKVF